MTDWNTFNPEWAVTSEDLRTELIPFASSKRVFSVDECDDFVKTIRKDNNHMKGATFGEALNGDQTNNREVEVWSSMNVPIRKKIFDVIKNINADLWNFHLDDAGIEPPQLCVYRGNVRGHYTWHKDSSWLSCKTKMRKLSYSILLSNRSSYSGGELELLVGIKPNGKPMLFESGLEEIGDICVFPSETYHRVKPVTQGTRIALVGWVWGERLS